MRRANEVADLAAGNGRDPVRMLARRSACSTRRGPKLRRNLPDASRAPIAAGCDGTPTGSATSAESWRGLLSTPAARGRGRTISRDPSARVARAWPRLRSKAAASGVAFISMLRDAQGGRVSMCSPQPENGRSHPQTRVFEQACPTAAACSSERSQRALSGSCATPGSRAALASSSRGTPRKRRAGARPRRSCDPMPAGCQTVPPRQNRDNPRACRLAAQGAADRRRRQDETVPCFP